MPTEPTGRKYQGYSTVADDNDAASPVGAPEGLLVGQINNVARYDKAAIAELAVDVGLATAEHAAADQAIGWQPQNDVALTGGNITGMTTIVMGAGYAPAADKDVTTRDYVVGLVGGGLPINSIIMWYGTAAAVPSGWSICDGTSGTPDLRSRFIQGATIDGDVGTTGGLASTTSSSNGSHNHSSMSINGAILTEDQLPSHTHAIGSLSADSVADHNHMNFVISSPEPLVGAVNNLGANEAPVRYSLTSSGTQTRYQMTSDLGATTEPTVGKSSLAGTHTHTLSGASATTGSGQSHAHTISYDSDGAHTHTVATVPAYTMLYYIMRTS